VHQAGVLIYFLMVVCIILGLFLIELTILVQFIKGLENNMIDDCAGRNSSR